MRMERRSSAKQSSCLMRSGTLMTLFIGGGSNEREGSIGTLWTIYNSCIMITYDSPFIIVLHLYSINYLWTNLVAIISIKVSFPSYPVNLGLGVKTSNKRWFGCKVGYPHEPVTWTSLLFCLWLLLKCILRSLWHSPVSSCMQHACRMQATSVFIIDVRLWR